MSWFGDTLRKVTKPIGDAFKTFNNWMPPGLLVKTLTGEDLFGQKRFKTPLFSKFNASTGGLRDFGGKVTIGVGAVLTGGAVAGLVGGTAGTAGGLGSLFAQGGTLSATGKIGSLFAKGGTLDTIKQFSDSTGITNTIKSQFSGGSKQQQSTPSSNNSNMDEHDSIILNTLLETEHPTVGDLINQGATPEMLVDKAYQHPKFFAQITGVELPPRGSLNPQATTEPQKRAGGVVPVNQSNDQNSVARFMGISYKYLAFGLVGVAIFTTLIILIIKRK